MPAVFDALFDALDESEIARQVGIAHDQAREDFRISKITVQNFREFENTTGKYYQHHFSRCVSGGGRLSDADAESRAKRMLESRLRRDEGDIVTWYRRCEAGLDGGMRVVLDTMCDAFKAEAISDYVRSAFDRHVAPHEFGQKCEIIKEFLARFGKLLGPSIELNNPARYAASYTDLINGFVESLRRTGSMFRRM